jgi:hypothetical protein
MWRSATPSHEHLLASNSASGFAGNSNWFGHTCIPVHALPARPSQSARLQNRLVAAALCVLFSGAAQADVIWNEQINGDFPNDPMHPTPLMLAPGDNSIAGRLEGVNNDGIFDIDYFSVTVPQGYQLSQINLETYLSVDQVAFIAIDPGPVFSIPPEHATIENLYGWLHFGTDYVGLDMLGPMSHNGRGFTPPLPAGTYSFWVQQQDDFTEYTSVFIVDAVPAPGAGAVLLLGATAILRRRR